MFGLIVPVLGYAEPPEYLKFGWTPAVGLNLSVDDPDGSTDTTSGAMPLSASASFPVGRDSRVLINLARYDFELDASQRDIGQKVRSTTVGGFYQWRLRLSRYFKPWIGFGPQIEFTDINARHTVDAQGFLQQTFPDRSGTAYAAAIVASHEWPVSAHLEAGVNAQYVISVKDALEGGLVGVSVLYHWEP